MKKKKSQEELGSWMDTYGDMVTLLLCFFVLLYSISTVDQNKWKLVVESFNPKAKQDTQEVVLNAVVSEDGDTLAGEPLNESGDVESDINELILALQTMIEERNMQDSVELTQGDGFTFISFRDKVFFEGNSSYLLQSGKEVLSELAVALSKANNAIKEVQVLGHTSRGNPDLPNNIRNDRMLSAQRSAEVIIYLQMQNAVSPEKLVGMSFGEYRPIASFDTAEGRARNRRVEILITQNDAVDKSLEEYYNQVYKTNQEETDN